METRDKHENKAQTGPTQDKQAPAPAETKGEKDDRKAAEQGARDAIEEAVRDYGKDAVKAAIVAYQREGYSHS